MAEGGLSSLDKSLADVGNAKSGFMGRDDVVIDHRGQVKVYVIFSHTDLFWDLWRSALGVAQKGATSLYIPTIWILTSTWMSFSDKGLILTRPGSTAR